MRHRGETTNDNNTLLTAWPETADWDVEAAAAAAVAAVEEAADAVVVPAAVDITHAVAIPTERFQLWGNTTSVLAPIVRVDRGSMPVATLTDFGFAVALTTLDASPGLPLSSMKVTIAGDSTDKVVAAVVVAAGSEVDRLPDFALLLSRTSHTTAFHPPARIESRLLAAAHYQQKDPETDLVKIHNNHADNEGTMKVHQTTAYVNTPSTHLAPQCQQPTRWCSTTSAPMQ
jgi:hypothetical protein